MPAIPKLLRLVAFALAVTAAAPVEGQDQLGVAAVVNDDVVTVLDLVSRMRLVMLASQTPDTPEARERLVPQVLRALIDDRLKLQEAKRLGIAVGEDDIDNRLDQIAKQAGTSADQFVAGLTDRGIPAETLRAQLQADIAWVRAVRRALQPRITVTEELVDETVAQIESERSEPAYLVSEIFLAVDDVDAEDEVRQAAERLVVQLRGGADFAAVARQFSEASSAAAGGDLGWVSASQLDPPLAQAVQALAPGLVSDPVRDIGGYSILALRDRRDSRGEDDTRATLAQVFFPLADDAGAEQAEQARAEARAATKDLASCEEMADLAQRVSPPDTQTMLRDVPLSEMPPDLRAIAVDAPVGEAVDPMRITGGHTVLMVCDRSGTGGLPSRSDVRERLGRDRLEVLARGYLRDLRRSAIVDIRL